MSKTPRFRRTLDLLEFSNAFLIFLQGLGLFSFIFAMSPPIGHQDHHHHQHDDDDDDDDYDDEKLVPEVFDRQCSFGNRRLFTGMAAPVS